MSTTTAKLLQTIIVIGAVSAAAMAPTTASANIFGSIAHAAKSVVKEVSHPKALVKDVSHTVQSVAKEVSHPKVLVKDTVRAVEHINVKKTLSTVGNAVGDVYSAASKVSANIPVAKDFRPLMRDAARAARDSKAQIAAVAGAGVAIASGGASYAATQAGGWGYSMFAGRREIQRIKREAAAKRHDAGL